MRKLAAVAAYSGLLLMLGYMAGTRAAHESSVVTPAPGGATAPKSDAAVPAWDSGPSRTSELTDWPNLTPED
jgi:hypothetical protein